MKKIWDSQNNQPLYAINEKALHERITSKKTRARHITNVTELLSIITYMTLGLVILWTTATPSKVFMLILMVWVFAVAAYLVVSRVKRIKANKKFDRSISGDLHHAFSVATYQVRLSQMMRWNMLVVGLLVVLVLWDGNKPLWLMSAILTFMAVSYLASGWEHNIYKSKRRELENLKNMLENEN